MQCLTFKNLLLSGKNRVKFDIVMHLTYMVKEWHLKKLGKACVCVIRLYL